MKDKETSPKLVFWRSSGVKGICYFFQLENLFHQFIPNIKSYTSI